MVSGRVGAIPLIEENFVKKNTNAIYRIVCKCFQNPLSQLLKQFSKLYQLGRLSRDHHWRGGIEEIYDFQGFWSISQRVLDISS